MTDSPPSTREHWDDVWSTRRADEVSWFQAEPTASLRLITGVTDPVAGVIDVGGGASRLVDGLLDAGYRDLTVLDVAAAALDQARERLGPRASAVDWVATDVTAWEPDRTFDVWHDRAVLHFLTAEVDRQRYVDVLRRSVAPDGHVVLATFAPDGPEACSGLPVRRHSAAELVELVGPGFALVEAPTELHRTPSGGEQHFQYVLLRRGTATTR